MPLTLKAMTRPAPSEHAAYFARYIDLVPGDAIVPVLTAQTERLLPYWSALNADAPPPPGKWTVKQVLHHIIDAERVFAYRALRIGRGDTTPLPGFDQDPWVATAASNARSWASLVQEYEHVRRASLALLESFPPEAWTRVGTASGGVLSTRAAAYVLAGHELHHEAILRASY